MNQPILSYAIQQRRYQAAVPFISRTVLDIGCGQANLPDFVPPLEMYVGLDVHVGCLQLAQKRYPQHQFYQLDLDRQFFPSELLDQRFQTITMMAILEHLAYPLHSVWQAAELLAPSGYLIVTTPTSLSHRVHQIGAYLGLFYREAVDEHKTVLDRDSLSWLFIAVGLEVVVYKKFQFGCNQLIVGKRRN